MDSDPPPPSPLPLPLPPKKTSITLKINGEWLSMIKIFMKGVMEGVVDGEEVAVKDASSGVVEGGH